MACMYTSVSALRIAYMLILGGGLLRDVFKKIACDFSQ